MVVGDLVEAWLLVAVEVSAGVGEVVESEVAHSDRFGMSWVLSPCLYSLGIEGDAFEDHLAYKGRNTEQGEESKS
jgi:hypothetical protein